MSYRQKSKQKTKKQVSGKMCEQLMDVRADGTVINPLTGNSIKTSGYTYRNLVKGCSGCANGATQCAALAANPRINPFTGIQLKRGSAVHNTITTGCDSCKAARNIPRKRTVTPITTTPAEQLLRRSTSVKSSKPITTPVKLVTPSQTKRSTSTRKQLPSVMDMESTRQITKRLADQAVSDFMVVSDQIATASPSAQTEDVLESSIQQANATVETAATITAAVDSKSSLSPEQRQTILQTAAVAATDNATMAVETAAIAQENVDSLERQSIRRGSSSKKDVDDATAAAKTAAAVANTAQNLAVAAQAAANAAVIINSGSPAKRTISPTALYPGWTRSSSASTKKVLTPTLSDASKSELAKNVTKQAIVNSYNEAKARSEQLIYGKNKSMPLLATEVMDIVVPCVIINNNNNNNNQSGRESRVNIERMWTKMAPVVLAISKPDVHVQILSLMNGSVLNGNAPDEMYAITYYGSDDQDPDRHFGVLKITKDNVYRMFYYDPSTIVDEAIKWQLTKILTNLNRGNFATNRNYLDTRAMRWQNRDSEPISASGVYSVFLAARMASNNGNFGSRPSNMTLKLIYSVLLSNCRSRMASYEQLFLYMLDHGR